MQDEQTRGATAAIPAEQPFLNTVRWLAAALVGFSHIWLMVINPDLARGGVAGLLTVVAQARIGFVVVFFVLSGYLVGGGVLERAAGLDVRRYATDRFSRIYVALIPAILLTLALDGTAFLLDRHNPVYDAAWPTWVLGGEGPFAHYRPLYIAATLVSLESIWQPPFGSNGALWSLGFEWFFYFLLPALVVPLARLRHAVWAQGTAALAVAALFLALGKSEWATYWAIWCAGAFVRLGKERVRLPMMLVPVLAAVGVAAFFWCGSNIEWQRRLAHLTLGGALALILSQPRVLEASFNRTCDHALASFSYSFYIVHLPVMTFSALLAWMAGWLPVGGRGVDIAALALVAALFATSTAVAFGFGHLFEARTGDVRRWLNGLGQPTRAQKKADDLPAAGS